MRTVAQTIPPSALHDAFRRSESHERTTGQPIIKLHVGEPFFRPPDSVINAMQSAIRDGRTAYTSAEGTASLREKLTAKVQHENHIESAPDHIFATPGSCQGLMGLLQSLRRPGATVLLPELHWPIYLQQALVAGLRPTFYRLTESFEPDLEHIASQVDRHRPTVIIVNSPANPTGAHYTKDCLTQILDIACRRSAYVISDEAYEHFIYGEEHISLASLENNLPARERRVFTTFSFSKSYAMTGLRLGYVVTPNPVAAAAFRTVQEASIIAPQTPVQFAGEAALNCNAEVADNASKLKGNRDLLDPLVRSGLLRELPRGGWYAMLDVERTGLAAEDFAHRLLHQHSVALAPGAGFSFSPSVDEAGYVTECRSQTETFLRIAFCGDAVELRRGITAINDLAAELTGTEVI